MQIKNTWIRNLWKNVEKIYIICLWNFSQIVKKFYEMLRTSFWKILAEILNSEFSEKFWRNWKKLRVIFGEVEEIGMYLSKSF